jgi:molybdate transport system substrate-binding protein
VRALAATAAVLAALLAGCGGNGSDGLVVLGASSLQEAMGEYDESFGEVHGSFAGSDQLAAQIRAGAPADVFASADVEYPARLHREGLVERPRVFARNRLVIVAAPGAAVRSLADLTRPGTSIVVGDRSVPVGAYTNTVLGRLPAPTRRAILANVRSEEPEVSSVLAKVQAGAADAGFVYVTDARAAGDLRRVALPRRLQPDVAYAAAVVRSSDDPRRARRYIAGLAHGQGAADLRRAGFLAP